MLRKRLIGIVLIVVVMAAIIGVGMVAGDVDTDRLFIAPLLGRFEVPPVLGSPGRGVAGFQYDGTQLTFVLLTSNVPQGLFAHIHCNVAGVNGPIGVTLSATTPIAAGTRTAPDAGNACGWVTLDDVAEAMANGGAYVNYHTPEHRSGELRGQIFEIS
jgi:hypothetical protein